MSILDTIRKAVTGRKPQIESGLVKAKDLAQDKLPDKYEAKIETVATKAKEALDKL